MNFPATAYARPGGIAGRRERTRSAIFGAASGNVLRVRATESAQTAVTLSRSVPGALGADREAVCSTLCPGSVEWLAEIRLVRSARRIQG